MKILITGAGGFIGKNLICELKNRGYNDLCLCHRGTTEEELSIYIRECDFIFHLAGVNRPQHTEEFMEGNFGFTEHLLGMLQKHQNKAPIVCTSSTQAVLDNPYGKSKLEGEKLLLKYADREKTKVYVFRLTNVFGKWCKPNYNSAVATFCHNIAHDMPIQVNDEETLLKLVYIDDVVNQLIDLMERQLDTVQQNPHKGSVTRTDSQGRYFIEPVYKVKLGKLEGLIRSFKESRKNLHAPDMSDDFTKKLYSTYLSYLPEDGFSYPLKMNVDNRGSFTEFLKSNSFGQVSVNISKPGITKGNHWHHTKNEKFLVVSGKGIIRFRKVTAFLQDQDGKEEIIEYAVSGEKLEVIDIPTGYTHNIINTGDTDMVTIMWANESFNPDKPDTYFLEV